MENLNYDDKIVDMIDQSPILTELRLAKNKWRNAQRKNDKNSSQYEKEYKDKSMDYFKSIDIDVSNDSIVSNEFEKLESMFAEYGKAQFLSFAIQFGGY